MLSFIKKLDGRSRALLYTCFFAFFCSGALTLTIGSAIPDLKAAYGLSDTLSGLFLSAYSAGNLAAGFVGGLIPLYLGQRKSIMLLSALGYAGFLMMIVWGNPVWLFLAFVLTGLGRGSVSNFDNRMVNILSGGSPAASNLLHASFAMGAIAAPMIFLAMSTAAGWRAGLCGVIALGTVSVVRLGRMRLEDDRPSRTDKVNSTLSFLKNPSFLIQGMMMLCYLCSEFAISGWLVTYIQSKTELLSAFGRTAQAQQAGAAAYSQSMATLLWTVILAGRLTCAALSARFSQKKLLLAASVGVALFFGMMLLSGTIPLVTASVAGLGFCMAGISPMIYSDAAAFTNAYPLATSALLCFGSSGAILMPVVVGAVAERFGFTGGMSAIYITVALLVVFATLNITVKPRKPCQEAHDAIHA